MTSASVHPASTSRTAPSRRRVWTASILILICAAGAYLRFDHLDDNDQNQDEYGQTVPVVRDMIATGKLFGRSAGTEWWDRTLPFLSFALEAAAVSCFGETDGVLRLFPALFGTFSIYLFYLLARRFLRPVPALASTFIFAISTVNIYYAREARYYGFLVFFALAALLLTLHIARRGAPHRLAAAALLIVVAAASIATHWFSVFYLAGCGAYLAGMGLSALATDPKRRLFMAWTAIVLGFIVTGILALSIVLNAARPAETGIEHRRAGVGRHRAKIESFLADFPREAADKWRGLTGAHGGWPARFSQDSKGYKLLSLMARTFSGAGDPFHPAITPEFSKRSVYLTWIVTGLALFGWIVSFRSHPRFAWTAVLWFLPPVLLFWLANPEHFVAPKYIIFTLPLYLLAISIGIDFVASRLAASIKPLPRIGRIVRGAFALALAVGMFVATRDAIGFVRFHRDAGWKQLAHRIVTEMPPDTLLCNLTNMPPDAGWDALGYYEGVTHTLLPRYLNGDGPPSHPVRQISGFDEWCDMLWRNPARPVLVFGPDESDRRDRLLVRWVRDHALKQVGRGWGVTIEPMFLPSPGIRWPADPAPIAGDSAGTAGVARHGALIDRARPLEVSAAFESGGRYELLASVALFPSTQDARLRVVFDGNAVDMAPVEACVDGYRRVRGEFTLADAGSHLFQISVESDPAVPANVWIAWLGARSLSAPAKYAMAEPGLACLMVDAAGPKCWEAAATLDRDASDERWETLAGQIEDLSDEAPVFLVARGRASNLIIHGGGRVGDALAAIGAAPDIVGRLKSESDLLIVGRKGAGVGVATVEPLASSSVRFFDALVQVVPGASPLPWRLGIANIPADRPERESGSGGFHLPRTFAPGVFFVPAGSAQSCDAGMPTSYVERSVRAEARLWSLFVNGVEKHREAMLAQCLDRTTAGETVWSLLRMPAGDPTTQFGRPARRWVVSGTNWQTLFTSSVRPLDSADALRLVMIASPPQGLEGVQFLLRTVNDEHLQWCPIPVDPEQTTPFARPLDRFIVERHTALSEIRTVELRVRPRGTEPVTIDVFDAAIERPVRPDQP